MGDVYSPHHINNARRASSPPRHINNARRASSPPRQIHNARRASSPPRQIHNARRASSHPRQIHNARDAGVYHPLSIHGEGVADRPGGEVRGLGGEVRQRSPLGANATKNARDTSLYRAWARGVQRLTYILRSPEPRVAIK